MGPHPQSFPAALGPVADGYAVNGVPYSKQDAAQHLVSGEVDHVVYHAVVQADLGHHSAPQVSYLLRTWCAPKNVNMAKTCRADYMGDVCVSMTLPEVNSPIVYLYG